MKNYPVHLDTKIIRIAIDEPIPVKIRPTRITHDVQQTTSY